MSASELPEGLRLLLALRWGSTSPSASFSFLRTDPENILSLLYVPLYFMVGFLETQLARFCIRNEKTNGKMRILNWITGPPAGNEDLSLMIAAAQLATGTQ